MSTTAQPHQTLRPAACVCAAVRAPTPKRIQCIDLAWNGQASSTKPFPMNPHHSQSTNKLNRRRHTIITPPIITHSEDTRATTTTQISMLLLRRAAARCVGGSIPTRALTAPASAAGAC